MRKSCVSSGANFVLQKTGSRDGLYLKLADKRLGLLINFNVALIRDGIVRIVNGLEDEAHPKLRRSEE